MCSCCLAHLTYTRASKVNATLMMWPGSCCGSAGPQLFWRRMIDRFGFQLWATSWPRTWKAVHVSRPFTHIHPFSSTSCVQVKKRMPPKKAAAPEKKVLLGRPSNNLKIGIVGLFFALRPLHPYLTVCAFLQACQMSANHHSSMFYRTQVRYGDRPEPTKD